MSNTGQLFSVKLHNILQQLVKRHFPFNLLSAERMQEVVNLIRFIEMKDGEIFQLRGSHCQDYLFLAEGSCEMICSGSITSINELMKLGRQPVLLPAGPETATLIARESTILCHINRELLDYLMAWDETSRVADHLDPVAAKRLKSVRNALVFQKLSLECLIPAFSSMQEYTVNQGDIITHYNQDIDAYYLILEGQAEVSTPLFDTATLTPVATLSSGDVFGEEAIIEQTTHRETVTITSETARLLVLTQQAYHNLTNRQYIRTVKPRIAQTMAENGFTFIDVRFSEEYAQGHIPDSINLPLHTLQEADLPLDQSKRYISYCHSGGRGAIATTLLKNKGYDILNLTDGIQDWPFELTTKPA